MFHPAQCPRYLKSRKRHLPMSSGWKWGAKLRPIAPSFLCGFLPWSAPNDVGFPWWLRDIQGRSGFVVVGSSELGETSLAFEFLSCVNTRQLDRNLARGHSGWISLNPKCIKPPPGWTLHRCSTLPLCQFFDSSHFFRTTSWCFCMFLYVCWVRTNLYKSEICRFAFQQITITIVKNGGSENSPPNESKWSNWVEASTD